MLIALILVSVLSGIATASVVSLTVGSSLLSLFLAYWLGGTIGALTLIGREALRPDPETALLRAM